MATSTNPAELLDVWKGWRTVSPPMRKDFTRFVELSNKGAVELGFKDTGAMWRSKYDMPADDFSKELDRLWDQVRPLYLSLHAYVRAKLHEKYGNLVPENGPIPADLLGNIWAQDWSNIYKLVAPKDADPGYDLTEILKARKTTPIQMVKYGEGFFTSLGFAPLPDTFWKRSLFVKPQDREVVCHASAWDVDNVNDLRIKMCINITEEDFTTIHHELGHNFYQRAYNTQPILFRDSANDGFHEAIGDTIALSVTPEYLVKLGLLQKAPDASKDIGLLLKRALDKIAFLPFGLMIDQWRWRVFSGEIPPDKYNEAWWQLRLKYQGIAPPEPRSDEFFDPGAKYHVPANVPYTRYFLAYILQFQFHKALAEAAGCPGNSGTPLHRCSIYDSKEAGKKLNTMLAMGLSKPWQDALQEMTGTAADGRHRDPGLLRAAPEVARRAEQGQARRLVTCKACSASGPCHNKKIHDRVADPPEVSRLFRRARPPRGPKLVAGPRQRSHAAVHQRRDEPVQGRVPGPGKARLHARGVFAEVRPRRRQAQRSG